LIIWLLPEVEGAVEPELVVVVQEDLGQAQIYL
jgi:hypothetical protein